MKILSLESSCDETAAAVIEDGQKSVPASSTRQVAEHGLYGGVVPEIASRRHTENIVGVTEKGACGCRRHAGWPRLSCGDGGAGPDRSPARRRKLCQGSLARHRQAAHPGHHLRSHIAANYLAHPELEPPFLCLVVSGGHSHIVSVDDYTQFRILGRTRDDAAGEAFDKAARAMGLPYPGGVSLDKEASKGDPKAFRLPKPHVDGCPLDMSFSGLKTAVVNILHNAEQRGETVNIPDLCASYQNVICHAVVDGLMVAAEEGGYHTVAAAGGVSANSGLRALLDRECKRRHLRLFVPPLSLCGDNGAMVGSQAYYEALAGHFAGLDLNAAPSMAIDDEF
jgi:N6-L-threonylcarbamoyladenine synthase